MWQINAADYGEKTMCRPHVQVNGSWKGSSNYDVTSAIGYGGPDLIGKKVHIKIAVKDGKTVDTYFNGSDTSAFTRCV